MPAFYRGSTPTIRLRPLGGLNVSDLGSPRVAMTQELIFYSVGEDEIEIDPVSNTISFKLPYRESMRFIPNEPVKIQQVWETEDGNVIPFPVHELTVLEVIVQIEDDVDVEEAEADEYNELEDGA